MVVFRKKRERHHEETRSWMSSCILVLIKYCFIPISIENDKIIFNFCSWKTCIHLCVSVGYMSLWFTLTMISTSIKPEDYYTAETSFAVNFSLTLLGFANVYGLMIPLLISNGLTKLDASFITNKNLRFPPKGCRIILFKLLKGTRHQKPLLPSTMGPI